MTWQVVKPRLPTLIQPAIDWVVPIGEPSLPTAIIRRGGLRLSSMRVPLCVCGIGFGAELRPGLFIGGRRFLVKSKSYTYSSKSTHFIIEVRGTDLVVSVLNGKFKATYYKATGQPHLILRERTRTDDHEMVDEAFRTAVAKARELGWIV
jgi:hypothetical protein